MPDLPIILWVFIGLLAGAIAGSFVPRRAGLGCLGTTVVGIAGGLLGGFLWTEVLDQSRADGWLGALVLAIGGSVIVLLLLRAVDRRA